MSDSLPNYEGDLKPASWLKLPKTPGVLESLRMRALPGCFICGGQGYRDDLSDESGVEICPCTALREEAS